MMSCRILVFVFLSVFWLIGTPAHAAAKCGFVRFAPGHSEAIIEGTAVANSKSENSSDLCYTFTAQQGQSATIKVLTGTNVTFSIDDVVDDQDQYRFTTERKTYRIIVGQEMRSVSAEPFKISVVIH